MNSTMIPIRGHFVSTQYIPAKKHIVPGNLDVLRNKDCKLRIPNVIVNPMQTQIYKLITQSLWDGPQGPL